MGNNSTPYAAHKAVKVLMLVENNPYPNDIRVQREAETLANDGYRVAVISPRTKKQPYHEVINGVAVYRFPFPPQGKGLWGYMVEFGYATLAMLLVSFWVWWSHGFDVIHAANPPDTLFVIGAFYKLFGKKYIFDHHDLAPETYLSRFPEVRRNLVYHVLRFLERCTFLTADRVIATNESYRKNALKRGKKKPEQVFVVRNGPPLCYQPSVESEELAAMAKHIIGYIGIIGPQDGVDYWLRAIHELVYTLNRRDFLAVIIGRGDAVPELKVLARDLEIEPYVWFTGWIPDADVLCYLTTTDICVHPDPLNPLNDHSTMNKMMDYMAMGKPVVSFDLVEARYSAQSAALYAKPNDVLDFATKIAYLMDHPEIREEMGKYGSRRFKESLAWEHSALKLLEAYRSLSGQPRESQSDSTIAQHRQEKTQDDKTKILGS